MPQYMYERLSAQDNSFLVAEQTNTPLHISAVGIYELGSAAARDGGVDVRRFKRFIEARLHEIPRYRQKLMWVPVENRPVWIDDPHFNIDYHIRHAALPRPGSVEELKKLTARITTRELDRSRPLWEIWIIEGLDADRFAIVSKIHHCMIDGAAGADIAQILNSPFPEVEIPEPRPFMPRPAPSEAELLVDAAQRMARMPLRALRGLAKIGSGTDDLRDEIATRARALGDILGLAMKRSSNTPLNGPLGPHRRVDWLTLPLDDVKAVRRALDCTVNDVVLATVTGAVRQYLRRRSVDTRDLDFRVSAPVSMRKASERGQMGNRVSTWIVRLPVEQDDPLEWVKAIRETTQMLKDSQQALGLEMMMKAAEYAPSSLMALGARAASGPINMIVTNVPGPQFPLYTLGAKLLEMQPLVPLLEGTGLGIALFSYDGKLHVGLNAEYELVPDLGTFTALFAQSFMALADRAGIDEPATAKPTEQHPAQLTSDVSYAEMAPDTQPKPPEPPAAALAS
ncbi:MAG: wax ester/triacylglycerol synthase family O-acyltransferase [Deltaproteobacteria bacterium]|nr:wax ester/triacylglycerol synthase family O-acyltransferase [Deltaproteobacteria bacterium]